jgi:hypothetical protein
MTTIPLGDKKWRAQDKYAQDFLTYMWENADTLLEVSEDGAYYRGSPHMLCRKVLPKAQAGDVVNIMKESGALISIEHGLWQLLRKEVFFDDEGNPISFDAPSFGHDPKGKVIGRQIREVSERVDALEDKFNKLTEVVVGLAKRLREPVVTSSQGGDNNGEAYYEDNQE